MSADPIDLNILYKIFYDAEQMLSKMYIEYLNMHGHVDFTHRLGHLFREMKSGREYIEKSQ